MEAFNDAVEKLLWPEKRDGLGSIWRTVNESYLEVPATLIPSPLRYLLKDIIDEEALLKIGPIPEGTPINLLANINLRITDANLKDLAKLIIKIKKVLVEVRG